MAFNLQEVGSGGCGLRKQEADQGLGLVTALVPDHHPHPETGRGFPCISHHGSVQGRVRSQLDLIRKVLAVSALTLSLQDCEEEVGVSPGNVGAKTDDSPASPC